MSLGASGFVIALMIYSHLGITFVSETIRGSDSQVIMALRNGDLLAAIKVHRELYSSPVAAVSMDEAWRAAEAMKGRRAV
jgi:hypothetical protein